VWVGLLLSCGLASVDFGRILSFFRVFSFTTLEAIRRGRRLGEELPHTSFALATLFANPLLLGGSSSLSARYKPAPAVL
jgi:hypothetical protein